MTDAGGPHSMRARTTRVRACASKPLPAAEVMGWEDDVDIVLETLAAYMPSDSANCHSQKQALVVRGAPGREIRRSPWSRTLCRRWHDSVSRGVDKEKSSEERVVVVEKEQEFASSTLPILFHVLLPLFFHRLGLGALK